MNGLQTIIVLGAGASYCYGMPTQNDIIGRLFALYDVTNAEGFPTFCETYGMKHSFPLGQFLRKYFNLPENPTKENAKLDFWPAIQRKGYTLESLYALLESVFQDESRYLLEDFEAIIRTAINEPTGERTFESTCEYHRMLIENLEPGDSIINFNWDTLAADALLYHSYLWFSGTGFGVPSVYPLIRNVTQKRHSVESVVQLFHLHGSVALLELVNPDKNARVPRYVYLGPKSYNTIGSFADFLEHKKNTKGAPSPEAEPSQEEECRFKYGWYWIKGHWYRPVFLPPSKYKAGYSSPYVRLMKMHIHNRLLSAQQIIIAGYSLPEADIDYLSDIFVPQIIDHVTKLKVVNPSNNEEGYRMRIKQCFPGISDIDYSEADFKDFCRNLKSR